MKQGEIWLINLDPTVGAEIKRPAAVKNKNPEFQTNLKSGIFKF
jgi:mRNA-degrading endonuclease toxin of MazEF toxin-antitoxin module